MLTGMRIEIVLFDGFDELDAFGPFEVLESAGLDVALVAAEHPGPVTSARGVEISVPSILGSPDGLIVPGGGWLDRAAEGAWAQSRRGPLLREITRVADTAQWISSVCTGAMLLASAGLLDGRRATTNTSAYGELRAFAGDVIEERVVDDGNVITAGGVTSGIDLGLWIVERELDRDAADRVADSLEYVRQGKVFRAAG